MKKILFLNTTKLAVLSAMLLLAVFCTIGMSFTPAEEGENVGNPNDSTYVTGPRRGHWTNSGCSSDTYSGTKDYSVIYAEVVVFNTIGEDITGNLGDVSNIGVVKIEKVNDDACLGYVTAINGEDIKTQLEWNCYIDGNEQENQDPNISKKHQLKIKLTATDKGPTDDYAFVGWTTNKTKLDDPSQYKTNPYVHTVGFPNNNGLHNYNGTTNYNPYPESNPYEITYYAHFSIAESNVVTLHPAKFGAYSCTYTDYSDPLKPTSTYEMGSTGDDGVEEKEIETKGDIVLKAKPAPTYKFFGWYEEDGDNEVYFSYDKNDTISIVQTKTIYAKFIPEHAALFAVKDDATNRRFWNLNEACQFAIDNNHTVVYPIDNGTLYPLVNGELYTGEISEETVITSYSIPSTVTLLIPNSEVKNMTIPTKTESKETLSIYGRLTMAKDVKIEVNGTICVAGRQYSATSGSNPAPGQPVGSCGALDMTQGGSVIIKSGASLYAYGFVVGTGDQSTSGTITVEKGGQVYENFIIADISGGGGTAACVNGTESSNNYELFPFNQYFIQNIEPKLTVEYGAALYAVFCIGGVQEPVNLIGANNTYLFQQEEGEESAIVKWYDYTRDYLCYEIRGKSHMNSINVSVNAMGSTIEISSSKFILPITHNTDITLAQNSELEIAADIKFLPGVNLTIEEGARAVVKGALYLYDSGEWDYYSIAYAQVVQNTVLGHTTRTVNRLDAFSDVSLVIDGELIIQGTNAAVYTTAGGANITSNGNGRIVYDGVGALDTLDTLYLWERYGTYGRNASGGFLKQEESVTEGTYDQKLVGKFGIKILGIGKEYYMYGTPIVCTPAKLHNDENKTWNADEYKYTQTAGSEAGDVYVYNSAWGRWRCERTVTWDANGGEVSPTSTIVGRNEPLSLYFTDLPTPTRIGYTFNGWNTEADGTGSAVTIETTVTDSITYYAQWTFAQVGDPLDIVDADGTNLTINANGWASSGWPYTVSVVTTTINTNSYEKTARQSDRTLKVPYSGDLNADMQIIVTNTSGTVSNHIYKVPFVYTGSEDLSAMDASSIVFVHSGTLTISGTDVKAAAIYVSPGAELNVTGTLIVGKLVLRTTPWQAAVLTNSGTITGHVYYSRIARDADFHLFAIPAGSNTAGVVLSDGTSAAVDSKVAPYGNAWQLREYNTARRAEKGDDGANWNNIGVKEDKTTYSDVDIEASKGYELRSGSKYYREYLFPVTLPTTATSVGVIAATGPAGAAHAGWNILCSPYTDVYIVEYDDEDPTKGITVSWQQQKDGSYWYTQVKPTVIPPAIPFAYQASAEGELNFAVPTIAAAPRKQSAAEALTETEWVHLDIFDAYGEGDETSLFVHPTRFEQTYKTGIDMAKQSLTAPRAILYTTHAYGDMAFAGVADSLLENGIDLVVYSPSAQELTFSLRENKFLNRLEYLWLADNETGARTDLLMDDYTFRADAGTAKGRFVLNGRFKAPQISTGIGNTQTDYNIYAIGNNIAISGVEQGTPIYVFDAVGHMIYTTAAISDEVIVPAPCAGVYMLSVGGQTAKLVINK